MPQEEHIIVLGAVHCKAMASMWGETAINYILLKNYHSAGFFARLAASYGLAIIGREEVK